jgi:hypothetical protein
MLQKQQSHELHRAWCAGGLLLLDLLARIHEKSSTREHKHEARMSAPYRATVSDAADVWVHDCAPIAQAAAAFPARSASRDGMPQSRYHGAALDMTSLHP